MQTERSLVQLRESLDDVLDGIENQKHRALFYLKLIGLSNAEIGHRFGHSAQYVEKVWGYRRYRDIRKRAKRAAIHSVIDTDPDYLRRARELRDRLAIPALEEALVNGSAREKVNAVRHLDEVTGMSKREVHITGSVDHRHVLQQPEYREFRRRLDSGQIVIEDDAPPDDVVDAEVIDAAE